MSLPIRTSTIEARAFRIAPTDTNYFALLFEPAGVRNTGNVEHPTLTAPAEGPR